MGLVAVAKSPRLKEAGLDELERLGRGRGSTRCNRPVDSRGGGAATSGAVMPKRKKVCRGRRPPRGRLDVGAVERAQRERAPFEGELHVARCPRPSLPAVEICSERSAEGDDRLRERDAVVRHEGHGEGGPRTAGIGPLTTARDVV